MLANAGDDDLSQLRRIVGVDQRLKLGLHVPLFVVRGHDHADPGRFGRRHQASPRLEGGVQRQQDRVTQIGKER